MWILAGSFSESDWNENRGSEQTAVTEMLIGKQSHEYSVAQMYSEKQQVMKDLAKSAMKKSLKKV